MIDRSESSPRTRCSYLTRASGSFHFPSDSNETARYRSRCPVRGSFSISTEKRGCRPQTAFAETTAPTLIAAGRFSRPRSSPRSGLRDNLLEMGAPVPAAKWRGTSCAGMPNDPGATRHSMPFGDWCVRLHNLIERRIARVGRIVPVLVEGSVRTCGGPPSRGRRLPPMFR